MNRAMSKYYTRHNFINCGIKTFPRPSKCSFTIYTNGFTQKSVNKAEYGVATCPTI